LIVTELFSDTYTNLGGGLDPQSGIFKAPLAGSYLFMIHVCTLDLHKALLSIRLNGKEVACFYDQNHESNHKNSMVSQSVLLNLNIGDKVQVRRRIFNQSFIFLESSISYRFTCSQQLESKIGDPIV